MLRSNRDLRAAASADARNFGLENAVPLLPLTVAIALMTFPCGSTVMDMAMIPASLLLSYSGYGNEPTSPRPPRLYPPYPPTPVISPVEEFPNGLPCVPLPSSLSPLLPSLETPFPKALLT